MSELSLQTECSTLPSVVIPRARYQHSSGKVEGRDNLLQMLESNHNRSEIQKESSTFAPSLFRQDGDHSATDQSGSTKFQDHSVGDARSMSGNRLSEDHRNHGEMSEHLPTNDGDFDPYRERRRPPTRDGESKTNTRSRFEGQRPHSETTVQPDTRQFKEDSFDSSSVSTGNVDIKPNDKRSSRNSSMDGNSQYHLFYNDTVQLDRHMDTESHS
ncbi:Uncharacterised protein at_DN0973 [Pycnogonum litorale]